LREKIKTMKNKILVAFFLLTTIVANAQLTSNFVMSSRPSANLSEWAFKNETMTLIVSNIGVPQSKEVKIRTSLKTADGTEVASTDMSQAKVYVFRDGNTVLNAAAVFPLEIQKFSGKFQNSLNRTGKLPAESYTLCVELVLATTLELQAPQRCRTFFVASAQLPISLMPSNNQVLDATVANTAITFRWTPLVPRPQGIIKYRIQVFEVLDNQQPMQALRSNQPILDKEVVGTTQYIWQPQGILGFAKEETVDSASQKKVGVGKAIAGKQFIWSIQSLDASGNPLAVDGNYEGRSEPVIFIISNKGQQNAEKRKKGYVGHVTLIK
jgi:hypothetical protein